ncbi:MAG: hypothetical protein IPM24_10020 [Bryobacterales bacterium]|nr:hypothetical protein [Bryobacterales bacterium]
MICAFSVCAQQREFVTGQAARLVIGQETFTDQRPGASDTLIGGASGLAYANDMLFVADTNRIGAFPLNHRVLIYTNLSQQIPKPTDELLYTQRCPACIGKADVVIGQPDFEKNERGLSQTAMRLPTAVASDGRRMVVADTDNNRVLIWNSIPSSHNAPADLVLGQSDFTSARIPPGNVPNASSFRGPQGVWIQGDNLFVADTQNHRVLIWNSWPTSNGQAANLVLGQPDFSSFVEPDLINAGVDPKPENMINPVSVTSDGIRLYVSDLGHNRVLVWNSLPTRNQQPADIAIGQPDLTSALSNNVRALCEPVFQDDEGNDVFPARCFGTLSFPRYALSDGRRLFIADGGNDRVLVFNRIPTASGTAADSVLGQIEGSFNFASVDTDRVETPMSLAWDGENLYVSDSFNRRITVYTVAEPKVPYTGVRNAASFAIFAVGAVTFAGEIVAGDEITISFGPEGEEREYKYTIVEGDTFEVIANRFAELIDRGEGDPEVFATPNPFVGGITLTARQPGIEGNSVRYRVAVSENARLQVTAVGTTLNGGQDAARLGPGTIVSVIGDDLSEFTGVADPNEEQLPTTLANTQVYADGIRLPLFFVSPTQINAQLPFEISDRTSMSAYVRTVLSDGTVRVTSPVAIAIVPQNPGIFAHPGQEPRAAVAFHGSPFASGTVSVDGSINPGETGTLTVGDREYTVTVTEDDTLASVRDRLVELINSDPEALVNAVASPSFGQRLRLLAKIEGPEGNGIPFSASSSADSQLLLSAFNVATCCANFGPVTQDNPAIPGEQIIVYATGLGISQPRDAELTGAKYRGPVTEPQEFVSSLAGGRTAQVLLATTAEGQVGTYELILELNNDLPSNPFTQLTIAQDVFVSNIVTVPIFNPNPPPEDDLDTLLP